MTGGSVTSRGGEVDGAAVRSATALARVGIEVGREDSVAAILRNLLDQADRFSELVGDDEVPAMFFDPRRCS